MFARWQDLGRISDRDSANGHCLSSGQMSLQVYHPVDAHFATFAKPCRMEHCSSCRDEYFIFHSASYDVSIGANETIVSDAQGVASRTSENGVFHDDALTANRYRPTLRNDLGSVHNTTARAHLDIATHYSIRCDPRGRVDLR